MRKFHTLAVLVLSCIAVLASDVHSLEESTFGGFITKNELVLAAFIAPWCEHCQTLESEYELAATALRKKNIPLAKVDCTVQKDLCKAYNVDSYPTIQVFRGLDVVKPYQGARKASAQVIISDMTKRARPAITLLTKDLLEEFKKTDKVVLMAYISADDKTSIQTYSNLAETLREKFVFGYTNDLRLAEDEGVTQPSIVLYKDFDDTKNVFMGDFSEKAIEDFIRTTSVPLIGMLDRETYADYVASALPLAHIFAKTPEEREELARALKPAAQKYRGRVNFATIDADEHSAYAGNLNLPDDKFPAFAIQKIVTNEKFPYSGNRLTEESISVFMEDFINGKLEPSLMSEPEPAENTGFVTILVATTFQDLVVNNDKDVLVEFYAPWCAFCKDFAPSYESLGMLYSSPASKSKVTIAKIDATANDVPVEVNSFPTIYLYPADRKAEPLTYGGNRTLDDLANFIVEFGRHQVDAPKAKDFINDRIITDSLNLSTEVAPRVESSTGAESDTVEDDKQNTMHTDTRPTDSTTAVHSRDEL